MRAVFETNFYARLSAGMMQGVLPSTCGSGRSGAIVNVTSVMGHLTLGCHGFYAATKFALAAVSESLAVEMKPFGVRVAIIEPGVILTPIWNKGESVMPEGHPYQQAMGRLWRLFQAQLADGTLPDVVARAIFESASPPANPKLAVSGGGGCGDDGGGAGPAVGRRMGRPSERAG